MSSIPLHTPEHGFSPLFDALQCGIDPHITYSSLGTSPDLQARLSELLGSSARDGLARYLELVLKWNARHDLTAARNIEELVDLFVVDAVVIAALCSSGTPPGSESRRWVDVGSGGGAPGLPLKIIWPALPIELVEPRTKRAAFLRTVVGSLQLGAARVHRVRSEQLPAGGYEVGVSRATFHPAQWLQEGARLCQKELWVLLAQADLPSSEDWELVQEVHYRWPLSSVNRKLARYHRRSS